MSNCNYCGTTLLSPNCSNCGAGQLFVTTEVKEPKKKKRLISNCRSPRFLETITVKLISDVEVDGFTIRADIKAPVKVILPSEVGHSFIERGLAQYIGYSSTNSTGPM